MMPICFNVSVYQMDDKEQMVEESAISKDDNGQQAAATESTDTSFVETEVVGNPMSSTIIGVDTEAIQNIQTAQASKSSKDFYVSVEENTSYNFSRTREFPNVPLGSASSKEK